ELPHHPIPGGSPHPQASDQHDVCHVLHLPPVETRRPYRTRVTTPDAGDELDQPLWAGRATRHASSLVSLRTYEEPRRELAFALDLDDPAGYAYEVVLDQPVGRFRDLDPARQSMGLHAASGVDRVAPDVVLELRRADHAGDHRSRV